MNRTEDEGRPNSTSYPNIPKKNKRSSGRGLYKSTYKSIHIRFVLPKCTKQKGNLDFGLRSKLKRREAYEELDYCYTFDISLLIN